ncbi:MAG: HEPN domain-containing protein [Bacteroidales bacterium]|nr:HEPN domain-containing protein [Bacteroidales bacterium]
MNEQERKELVQYRINRAKDTLKEVNIHVENELWSTAVNRLYYACYYAVSALLLQHKIKAQTHAGVRRMFGLHFVKKGLIDKDLARFYTDIFDKRQTSDYDDFIEFSREEVVSLIPSAEQLIEEIEKLLVD